MSLPDRRNALAAQNVLTGIDFVAVDASQTTLDVFFLVPPLGLTVPLNTLLASAVRIHSADAPDVPIVAMAWAVADARDVLRLNTAAPGGFAGYLLTIDDPRIDAFFNGVAFSFKANCPSLLDCEPPPHECPPEAPVDFPVDTLARDFWSFRKALLDFAAQRHPDWQDRLEADVGVMLAEALASLGDEMAYYQDRVAREAALGTATQRRSLRRHGRLVDYEIHDGKGAFVWLDVRVASAFPLPQSLTAGDDVWALSDVGERVSFEIGRGLDESFRPPLAPETYEVRLQANSLDPHIWDETAACLPVGATEMHVEGHHNADLPLVDAPPDGPAGRWVLLATTPPDPAIPARRWIVRLLSVTDELDPLVSHPVTGNAVTRLRWEAAQALPFEIDLEHLKVHGNVVPATAGRTVADRGFRIGPSTLPLVPDAVERAGPNGANAYLFTLPDANGEGLVRLGDDARTARPEVRLFESTPTMVGPNLVWTDGRAWQWRRSLLGTRSSRPADPDFTLDDGTWDRAVGYQRLGGEVVHRDYLSTIGTTVRFGDGEFGLIPAAGTWFHVVYRLGGGARTNVAAGSLVHHALPFVEKISNPLPAAGGVDPETFEDLRRLAPDAFRAVTFRAVTPGDYAEAAERLPWVQRAGATLRWTGSWLACAVTADPRSEPVLTRARRRELDRHVDRFRQAGRAVHILAPRYADLDLVIHVCVEPHAFPGDVIEAVMLALFGKGGGRPQPGFFDPDRFTFGTPLDRSELEAAIQRVPGVRAVENMDYRRRGWFDWKPFADLIFRPADNEVIRVENDPLHPDRGTARIETHGGA